VDDESAKWVTAAVDYCIDSKES